MASGETEVAIIGGGAAGVAAARHLRDAGIDCLLIEARDRLGGRAWTVPGPDGAALDLGCGWLHSADRNPWVAIARAQGLAIDKAPPPWTRSPLTFQPGERDDFHAAMAKFFARVSELAGGDVDVPVSAALVPGGRWNALLGAIVTFISGDEPEKVSARDFDDYDNTEVNWRVVEGYGTAVANHGRGVPAALGCAVQRIDHSGRRLTIDTTRGTLRANRAIVTLPTTVLAGMETLFAPALPEKTQAARDLPLGLAAKLFFALEGPEEFEPDGSLFGKKDSTATAAYHLRPFGRPQIEAYFGGTLARGLEAEGEAAFFDFAVCQLGDNFGGIARRLKPIRIHRWGADPFARGAYSYAVPGRAGARAILAAPVDDRLFFAGEACSKADYSTAHGAYLTGIAAAAHAMNAMKR